MAMRQTLTMIGFGASLAAASVVVALAEPAPTNRTAYVHKDPSNGWHRWSAKGRTHCGQRSFSVSVGNPAFEYRVTDWPAPCDW
jgi:hypothetical protein